MPGSPRLLRAAAASPFRVRGFRCVSQPLAGLGDPAARPARRAGSMPKARSAGWAPRLATLPYPDGDRRVRAEKKPLRRTKACCERTLFPWMLGSIRLVGLSVPHLKTGTSIRVSVRPDNPPIGRRLRKIRSRTRAQAARGSGRAAKHESTLCGERRGRSESDARLGARRRSTGVCTVQARCGRGNDARPEARRRSTGTHALQDAIRTREPAWDALSRC